jgi:hypothetical protein
MGSPIANALKRAAKASTSLTSPGSLPPVQPFKLKPLKKADVPLDPYAWTDDFSQKVWDYWSFTNPVLWGEKQQQAAKQLGDLGLVEFANNPDFDGPVAYVDGHIADPDEIEKLSAQYLDPEFYHTSAGLPPEEWSFNEAARLKTARTDYARRDGEGVRDYVSRLRELSSDPIHKRGVAEAVSQLEGGFANDVRTGQISGLIPEDGRPATAARNARIRDYLDYLAANGVDQRTLDSIASWELTMDPLSRERRAQEMGLDPKAIWYRWDSPLKSEMRGYTGAALSPDDFRRKQRGTLSLIALPPSREGLVYTSHNKDYAKKGVQVPQNEIVLYPLIGPRDGIAGIDELPPQAYEKFADRQAQALLRKYPDNPRLRRDSARKEVLAEQLVDPENWEPYHTESTKRAANLSALGRVEPGKPRNHLAGGTLQSYPVVESRKEYTEPLMASGAKGTLVADETGLATAFTPAGASALRRADLAPLDTRFRLSRNILQSLLLPAVVAAGASQQSPGVLSGLTEKR